MRLSHLSFGGLILCLGLLAAGCRTTAATAQERRALELQAEATLQRFQAASPQWHAAYTKTSRGHAVFPNIGKGAVGLGGAYGRGVLYEGGRLVGYCDMTQVTIGLQLGGQSYAQIIYFQNDRTLDDFKANKFEFAAGASAVAADADASTAADYRDGVAVLTLNAEGLMFEAALGGQRFTYVPKDGVK